MVVIHGYNFIVESFETQNCQKLLKLMIFRDSLWTFTVEFGHENAYSYYDRYFEH